MQKKTCETVGGASVPIGRIVKPPNADEDRIEL